jgi:hypothetical protein
VRDAVKLSKIAVLSAADRSTDGSVFSRLPAEICVSFMTRRALRPTMRTSAMSPRSEATVLIPR